MVVVSPAFTEQNAWARGIRREQAQAAFDDPDGRADLPVDEGIFLTLVTKRTERPRPHVMILIGSATHDVAFALHSGYRLFGSESIVDALRAEPRRALAELIRRFGREFSVGGGPPTKYVETLHMENFEFDLISDLDEMSPTTLVRRAPGGGFDV